MPKINILSPLLADKIAAGEVIERPAAVVKELVENALDAGSSAIDIVVEDAGCALIRIIDDGEGMDSEDLQNCCLRHATSKISKAKDLERINTLGFRGEALSSIAAVSRLSIVSATRDNPMGWILKIEGGKIIENTQTARIVGTTVEVRNLFFNTPARLKFLKTRSTELFHIVRIISELALAYPEVSFSINNEKKGELLRLNKETNLKNRIPIVIGADIENHLIALDFQSGPLKISGFISRPGFSLKTRKSQFIFVNKRPIQDKTIAHAVQQAYHTLLADRQFPAIVLFIDTPPDSIDINVHPTKREIRIRESSLLHDILVKVIKDALIDKNELPDLSGQRIVASSNFSVGVAPKYEKKEMFKQTLKEADAPQELFASRAVEPNVNLPWDDQFAAPARECGKYLQVKDTYIITQDTGGIIIIDQHAAHERILFDELLVQFKSKRVEKQKLLLPVTVNLNAAQALLMEDCLTLFRDLGFDVEDFGDNSFIIQAYPAVLGEADISGIMEKIIMDISEIDFNPDIETKITQVLAPIACHAAIRAHEKLKVEQIEALLERLWQTTTPYTCPHGRPTIIKFSWYDLERQFKRK